MPAPPGKKRQRLHSKLLVGQENVDPNCKLETGNKGEQVRAPRSRNKPPPLPEICEEMDDRSYEAPNYKRYKVEVAKLNDDDMFQGTYNVRASLVKASKDQTPPKDGRCDECMQFLDDEYLRIFEGDPPDALEELLVLTDKRLEYASSGSGSEDVFDNNLDRPDLKVTLFSIYDKYGHLCPFDEGLVEQNDVELWFSGIVKPFDSCDSSAEGGVMAKRLGPIIEWWICGYEGRNTTLGISTEFAEYGLMEPSRQYKPYMLSAMEKIHMSKSVIEFVSRNLDATFDDLMDHIQNMTPPEGVTADTQDSLITHAQFIVDQITGYDSTAELDEPLLLTTRCIRALMRLASATVRVFQKRQPGKKEKFRKPKKVVAADTKATTTPLVQSIIGNFFPQLIEVGKADGPTGKQKRRSCGACASCNQPDCGKCNSCQSRQKLGKKGQRKFICAARVCLNVAVQEAEEDEGEEEEDCEDEMDVQAKVRPAAPPVKQKRPKAPKSSVIWTEKPALTKGKTKYFAGAQVNTEMLKCGDHVLVEPLNRSSPILVARVAYLFEDEYGDKMFHAHWFMPGAETILGETSHKSEVFLVDDCDNVSLGSVISKCNVFQKAAPPNWFSLGGTGDLSSDDAGSDDGKTFFYQKWYDPTTASLEDPPVIPENLKELEEYRSCDSCYRINLKNQKATPCLGNELCIIAKGKEAAYSSVAWKDVEYKVDDTVFLRPETFTFKEKNPQTVNQKVRPKKIDETLYPEHYRKSEHGRGVYVDIPDPFRIARILSIAAPHNVSKLRAEHVKLKIEIFYRPENTHLGQAAISNTDINLLYWTNEETEVRLSNCAGKCSIVFCEPDHDYLKDFSMIGPCKFYFHEAYDSVTKSFGSVPKSVQLIFSLKLRQDSKSPCPSPSGKKLRSMDVFAGCGGLSEGFHQVGMVETLWAIEKEEAAADAFKKNNPKCTVYREDCNKLLKLVMGGHKKAENGQWLPQKGDVDVIVGGPPCQGFSGMNRFNHRQYSLFKNSLIATFLSICDYYRPKFVVMENVRNFVAFKKGMVLKLALRCFIGMGYQCRFGVLQAGNHGVPQTRRRAIILAAAPGERLPLYPEPVTAFTSRGCQLTVMVDNKKYVSNIQWTYSAPYRRVTVLDSMSDLPAVENGAACEQVPYAEPPKNSFQKMVRRSNKKDVLRDHICKEMSSLAVTRFKYVPHAPGSDWRDLPNIVVQLSGGKQTRKLKYTHHDVKNGKSSNGDLRGVCSCAEGRACDPMERQLDTLIPWCLPHTGNRHNNWAGLYGRLSWDGFFLTTVTNPEPMGKQGCVVHPEQDRVVTVRECARSQGFPDSYTFSGNILDRHRQIGNAVPPPLAAAIALEISKCISNNPQ